MDEITVDVDTAKADAKLNQLRGKIMAIEAQRVIDAWPSGD